jgi:mannose-6-phosphate isomerase-like protein (cupin superfamily)
MDKVGITAPPEWDQPAYSGLTPVDLKKEAGQVTDTYKNFVLFNVNQHCVRLAVMSGEYRWHRHPHSDECFLIVEGEFEIDLDDGRLVVLKPWQMFTIPAGVRHRTRARMRTVNICFEEQQAYREVVFDD